jgi:hypothetical protein
MDPLSEVLSFLKPRSYSAGGFDAGGDWSVHFARIKGIKCYAVVSGQCWLSVEGTPAICCCKAGIVSTPTVFLSRKRLVFNACRLQNDLF